MGRIFAVHPVKDDLTPALRFGGPILYACDRYVYSDEITEERTKSHLEKVAAVMRVLEIHAKSASSIKKSP